MTDADIKRLESKLHFKLPPWYVKLVLRFSQTLSKLPRELAGQGLKWVMTDAEELLNLNLRIRKSPADFIDAGAGPVLSANARAQADALAFGTDDASLPPHRQYPGNRPSSYLTLEALNPRNLGRLLALYEHKVFVQGVVWNINSFDQWGVELGKALANEILKGKR